MFQFYLSSIKSGSGQGGSSFSSEFQFYLSSIKRRLELVVIRLLRSFNSTLVQLKDESQLSRLQRDMQFQFYLSSIKSRFFNYKTDRFTLFQFYLSSIKSNQKWRVKTREVMFQFYLSSIKSFFNSIRV